MAGGPRSPHRSWSSDRLNRGIGQRLPPSSTTTPRLTVSPSPASSGLPRPVLLLPPEPVARHRIWLTTISTPKVIAQWVVICITVRLVLSRMLAGLIWQVASARTSTQRFTFDLLYLPVSPTARHAFEQNVGGFVMENVGDRLSGAAATTVNSFVVAPGEFDLSTAIRSGTHGFLYGGSGPTQGLRVGN